MGLKQDIVVVNEYTVPLPGGGGSRGGTPGDYVTRYMARDGATETLAPIQRTRTDDFILRYMARESAVEALEVQDVSALKSRMASAQGAGGTAFGYGSISLSHEQLRAGAKDIQRLFEEGHTVMKTVISFDQDYLVRRGIVEPDFTISRRGGYRGNIDQMKLRMAITHGMDRMGRMRYDDLRWIGVIQVDTEQVHAHLAMVDAGEGIKHHDGTQKGKIPQPAIHAIRRGVDAYLDENQRVAHLSSAVGYERRNVSTYVKRWAHQQALRESLPQFLLATLPADRRLWRADTNRKEMAKPNRIVRELVGEVLARPGSPMGAAMAKVHDYADHRRREEGLDAKAWAKLVENGREGVIERGVNAVYSTLRQLPEDSLRVRTPMLDVMGMDYEQLASKQRTDSEDDLVGFSYRLRSYSSRLKEHTSSRQENHDQARRWEAANEAGVADPASRALYLWYLEEEEYQAKCAAKYRRFLPFGDRGDWQAKWEAVADYGEAMISLESMTRDASLKRTKDPDEAERIGREVYGQTGGHLVALGDEESTARLQDRVDRMRAEYGRKVSDLRAEMAGVGMVLQIEEPAGAERPQGRISAGAEYDFEAVKGLDMHHMRYDFSQDVEVGRRARSAFVAAARRRAEALEGAVAYLEGSGQSEAVAELPVDDVRAMSSLANSMSSSRMAMLPSEVARLAKQQLLKRSRTVRLGAGLARQVDEAVNTQVQAIEAEEVFEAERSAPGLGG